MKYKVRKPFIGHGVAAEKGEYVDLTAEQAEALGDHVEYETKVAPPVENKVKKPSGSSRVAPRLRKKIAKRSRKTAKK